MSAHHPDIPELDAGGLRRFAFVTGGMFIAVFGLLIPWLFSLSYPLWPWILAAVLSLWGLLAPESLRPVYTLWMRFALLLNRITTPLILGIIFGLLLTPVALFMKIIKRDTMARGFDKSATTYRVISRKVAKEHMERPF